MVNFRASEPLDQKGNSPLHIAAFSGHADIAELLIRKFNADIDLRNNLGETALHLACNQGHKNVIERLLLARASTNIKDGLGGNTPLHVLALVNHLRAQMTTVISDTVRQTMDSANLEGMRPPKVDSLRDSLQDEHLVTEDFHQTEIPRCSLIELILPFAEESKQIANDNGLLPW